MRPVFRRPRRVTRPHCNLLQRIFSMATRTSSKNAVSPPVPASAPAASPAGGTGVRMVTVADDRDGQRIDNWLTGQLKGVPKSLIYRILRTGQVRINGKRAKPDARVAGGDE